jgi:hypothetical protein
VRARPLLAALTAATLVAGSAVATALPANAAPCEGLNACALEVQLTGPERIGLGGDWNDYEVELTNPTDEPVDVDSLAVELDLGEGASGLEFLVEHGGTGNWESAEAQEVASGSHLAILDLDTTVGAEDSETVEVRVAAFAPSLLVAIALGYGNADILNEVNGYEFDLDMTVTALGRIPEMLLETPRPELDSDSLAVTLSLLDIDVPTKVTTPLGKPTSITGTLANDTGSDYETTGLLPVMIPGQSDEGAGIKKATNRLQGASSSKQVLRRLQAAAASAETIVELKVDGTWYQLDSIGLELFEVLFRSIADGTVRSDDWRFTFRDPALVADPSATPSPVPSDTPQADPGTVIWVAARFPENLIGPQVSDGFPSEPQLVGVAATVFTVTEPVAETSSPSPTPSATAEPTKSKKPKKNKGADDQDGAGDDGGEGAGGELAQSGYDLTGQATWALMLLVLGGLTVLATVRRRVTQRG